MKTAVNSFFQSMLATMSSFGSLAPEKILGMFEKSHAQPVFLEKYQEFVGACSLRTLIEHHQSFSNRSSGGRFSCSAREFYLIAKEKLFATDVEKFFSQPGITIQEIMYVWNLAGKNLSDGIEERIADFFVKDVLKRNLNLQSFEAEYANMFFLDGPEKLQRCYVCVRSNFLYERLQEVDTVKELKPLFWNYSNERNEFLFFERLEKILALQSLQDLRMISEHYSHAHDKKTLPFARSIHVFTEKAEAARHEELSKKMFVAKTLVDFIALGEEVMNVEGARGVFAKLLQKDRPRLEKAKGLFKICSENESFMEKLVEYYRDEIPRMNAMSFGKLWNIRFDLPDAIKLLLVEPMLRAIEVEHNLDLLSYPLVSSGFEGEDEIKAACRKRAEILILPIVGEIVDLARVRKCWGMVKDYCKAEKMLEKRYVEILLTIDSPEILEKLLSDHDRYEDLLHVFVTRRYKIVLSKYLRQEHSFDELCLRRKRAPWEMRGGIERKMSQMAKHADVTCLARMLFRRDLDSEFVLKKISKRLAQLLPEYLASKRSIDELLVVFRAAKITCYYYGGYDWSRVENNMRKLVAGEKSLLELFRIYEEYEKLEIYERVKVLDRCKEVFSDFLSVVKSEQEIREVYEVCPLLFKGTFLMLCREAIKK